MVDVVVVDAAVVVVEAKGGVVVTVVRPNLTRNLDEKKKTVT